MVPNCLRCLSRRKDKKKKTQKSPQKTAKPFDTSDKVLDELCVAKGDCYEETYTCSGLGVNGSLRF